MKILIIIGMIVCSALVLFGLAIFLAWVFGGIYVSEQLFVRAFIGGSSGVLGLFCLFIAWVDYE